jgi:hypothetical protein
MTSRSPSAARTATANATQPPVESMSPSLAASAVERSSQKSPTNGSSLSRKPTRKLMVASARGRWNGARARSVAAATGALDIR